MTVWNTHLVNKLITNLNIHIVSNYCYLIHVSTVDDDNDEFMLIISMVILT